MPKVEIEDRVEAFALRTIALFRHLHRQKDAVAMVLGKQLLRSATSIGANLIEARAGESRRDFVHKCTIALKEARETAYWLRLMLKAGLVSPKRMEGLCTEANEIAAVITAIVVNTKRRPNPA